MKQHHHLLKHHQEVCLENRNLHIYHVNRVNQHKIQLNDTYEVLAVILVTTKKLHLGNSKINTFAVIYVDIISIFLFIYFILIFVFCFFFIFSISNYPNYESHMPPPARFLDTTTGEKKSTSSSPRIRTNAKLHREAFQINV